MFQSENLQPFSPSLMNYMPNCNVRYPPHPAHRNHHGGMYRSLSHHHLNENPPCTSSSFNLKYQAGYTSHVDRQDQSQPILFFPCRSMPPQPSLCHSKYEDEVFQSGGDEQERRHCEKFNELNHPLMAIDCRKNTEIRSLSPTDSGISSQSSTPGHFQKYKHSCPKSSPLRYYHLTEELTVVFLKFQGVPVSLGEVTAAAISTVVSLEEQSVITRTIGPVAALVLYSKLRQLNPPPNLLHLDPSVVSRTVVKAFRPSSHQHVLSTSNYVRIGLTICSMEVNGIG